MWKICTLLTYSAPSRDKYFSILSYFYQYSLSNFSRMYIYCYFFILVVLGNLAPLQQHLLPTLPIHHSCYQLNCAPHLYLETLTLSVPIFGDRDLKR